MQSYEPAPNGTWRGHLRGHGHWPVPSSAAHGGARARNPSLREPRHRSWAWQRGPAGRCAGPAELSRAWSISWSISSSLPVWLSTRARRAPGSSAVTAPHREAAPGGCPASESHGPAVPATVGLEVCSELKEEITDKVNV